MCSFHDSFCSVVTPRYLAESSFCTSNPLHLFRWKGESISRVMHLPSKVGLPFFTGRLFLYVNTMTMAQLPGSASFSGQHDPHVFVRLVEDKVKDLELFLRALP